MGYWGSGVYENDQALDIVAEEVTRYAREVDDALAAEVLAWDDLDAPLVFLDLLARLGAFAELVNVTESRVIEWRRLFRQVMTESVEHGSEESAGFDGLRRRVVEECFERLLGARLWPEAKEL